MRQERIDIAGRELLIARPENPESLIDEERFEEDEFLPYWAELWPSGVALARHVAAADLAGIRVLEVGCGLALPSFAAALAGADVLATDWAPEALDLVAINAEANRITLKTALLDWSVEPSNLPPCVLVLAADVLYEERNSGPLLRLLETTVGEDGYALVADPGRRHAAAFFAAATAAGWSVEHVPSDELRNGGIRRLRKAEARTDLP
jgi:predicted nicotinamide N-methyase